MVRRTLPQWVPELVSTIQSLAGESGRMRQYVLPVSQKFSRLAGITQSSAGRAALIELYPMRLHGLAQAGRAHRPCVGALFEALVVNEALKWQAAGRSDWLMRMVDADG